MRASASSATAKVTKRRIVQLVAVVAAKGADGRGRRTKRARVVEARTEGQEGQSNKQEERNNDAPGPAPAYDPASVIDYIKTLNQQEQDDFSDRVMEGGMGFNAARRIGQRPRRERRSLYSVY